MNKRTYGIVLSVLAAQAVCVKAQTATNSVRLVITNPVAAARANVRQSDYGRIATNTPAFEEYGLNFMLSKANEVREKWMLDIPKPLTVQDVLFTLKATAYGVEGGIQTRDYRFSWTFEHNSLTIFQDHQYWPRSFRHHDDESARLAKIKSLITAQEAEKVARDRLVQLGLDEKKLQLKSPPVVNQYKFEEIDGLVYPLPMFKVSWREDDAPKIEPGEIDYRPVELDISGITKNVAEYFNVSRYAPRNIMPTTYLQMLGLPANYLDTLPEKKRSAWGLPPLTNSSVRPTNSPRQ